MMKHILLFIISTSIWISFAITRPYIIVSSEDKNGMSVLLTGHGIAFSYRPMMASSVFAELTGSGRKNFNNFTKNLNTMTLRIEFLTSFLIKVRSDKFIEELFSDRLRLVS